MKNIKHLLLPCLMLIASTHSYAAEQTITLDVENMTCASCPYQVRKSLERVDGVISAEAILETGTAIVVFEDSLTTIAALTEATGNAGYPSQPSEASLVQVQ